MSNPIIGGLDAATGIVVEREMTDEEAAEYEAFCARAYRVPDPE